MARLAPLVVSPGAFYELIMQPAFQDVPGEFTGVLPNTLHEWVIMDNVSLANGRPLIDILAKQNFLKRKDRSCKVDWSKVANMTGRRIYVNELYGAVENCQEEFYDGAFKDFRDQNDRFKQMITGIFQKGITLDMLVNAYFGDLERADDTTGTYSWNKYDGIFTRIADAVTEGTIPGGQVLGALPAGPITPSQAYNTLSDAYDAQSDLMQALADESKAFYVDKRFAYAYWRYMVASGQTTLDNISLIMNGMPALKFNNIPIYIESMWNPIMRAISDAEAHACILTLRGNWIFGTDKTYGGGPELNQAYRVWWSEDDEVWRQKAHMVAGTEILYPQHIVFGMTNIE